MGSLTVETPLEKNLEKILKKIWEGGLPATPRFRFGQEETNHCQPAVPY
jgi:hypothetical protein